MKKLSFLAASVALVLSGCGSDSSTNPSPELPPTNPTVTNAFIDAAVEGIYYSAMPSGMSGFTDSEGSYEAKEQDTITFFLGGENGVKIGAASNREVLTPFEAAGKYNRALNLAIILQSLDNEFGSTSDSVLTVPATLKDIEALNIAKALADLNLDSRTSSAAFLTAVGVSSIVTEDVAIAHMEESFGNMKRGTDTPVEFFQKGSGSIIRAIYASQYETNKSNVTYVHADKMLTSDLFEDTRGMPNHEYRLDNDNIVVLAGSNDSSLSEAWAKKFLDCVAVPNNTWDYTQPNGGSCVGTPIIDNRHYLGTEFAYSLLDQSRATSSIENISWNEKWLPLGAATEQALNHYSDSVRDDSDLQDGTGWQREINSGSYDLTTQIYTEINKKIKLIGSNCDQSGNTCADDRIEESVSFYYEILSVGSERYVDFKGTWTNSEICTDGTVATSTNIYDDIGLTMSGFECKDDTSTLIPTENHTYAELATIDLWWFNQVGRESQATLTELNSVVRFCDDNGYVPGNACSNEFFVKWDYQPAGQDWDEGLLIRQKMLPDGSRVGTMTMQKVK